MFGYILLNAEGLTADEKRRYNEVYCGLCHSLGELYGGALRLALSYDMTFLAMFLTALYEPEEKRTEKPCIIHPRKSEAFAQSKFTEYAADMTIILTYYKCLDDWRDDKSIAARGGVSILRRRYDEVKAKYSEKCGLCEKYMEQLSEIEKSSGGADEALDCFGRVLGEIFRYRNDEWGATLYLFGKNLGKFIYAMDAAMDYDADIKRRKYNPFAASGIGKPEFEEILKVLIGKAAEIFEKLPIIQDENILRNIIYSGVWYKFGRKMQKERAKENGAGSV